MLVYLLPHLMIHAGGPKFVLETAERISKKGSDVLIILQDANEDIIKQYNSLKYSFIGLPLSNTVVHWPLTPVILKKIANELDRVDVDLLFLNVFPATYWGFLYKLIHKDVPCVLYAHDRGNAFIHEKENILGLSTPLKQLALFCNNIPAIKSLDKILTNQCDLVISNSEYTATFIKEIYGIPSIVVNPGVDIYKFKPMNEKEDFIFTVGRLTKIKRNDILIKAIWLLKRSGIRENLKLYVAGEGEDKNKLLAMRDKLGLQNEVIFLGTVRDDMLKLYYAKAGIVVCPSVNEPFGLVALEAMSSGTAVVASNSGGFKETIIDGKTGLLFNPDDPADLAYKIELLLSNEELRRDLGKSAREHSMKYSWDKTTENLLQVFKELL